MALALTLLGETAINLNGKGIKDLSAEKARALLFYLAVESDRAHRRDFLAEMFWPGKPEGYGRNNLKQTLSQLRTALGDREAPEPFLISSVRDLQFNTNSTLQVDLLEFESLAKEVNLHCHAGADTCDQCKNLLEQAATLYKDDFLVDFYLSDSPEFNEWTLARRESSKRQMADILGRLITCYQAKGDYKTGAEYAKQLVDLEPWSESSQRTLIRLLAASGKRSAALKQYHACERMLAAEFDAKPTPRTIALYERIKNWKPEEGSQALIPEDAEEVSTGRQITAIVQEQTSHLKYWIIGSLAISLLILIGFGSTRWAAPNPLEFLFNPGSIIPGMETYLQGDDPNLALAAIYHHTGGSNWTHTEGWLGDQSPCTWHGITCQGSEIVGIHLADNNLAGGLPPEIGDIPSLLVLDLSHNQFEGPIPEEIGLLVNLKYLNLEGNFGLSGDIPPEIGNLQNLEELILSSASAGGSLIGGELPPEIGKLIKLDKLIIEDTLIRGEIPTQLGNLSQLTVLSLSQNNLSGPLPDEIFNLSKLRSLDLWANQNLGSSLSSKIGRLTHLDFLNISHNQFSGNLPAELGTMINLDWIGLHDNPFEGPIPTSMAGLSPSVFQFENTNLCEPSDPDFQAWLHSIPEVSRTGEICNDRAADHFPSRSYPAETDLPPLDSELVCLAGETLVYQQDFQNDTFTEWPQLYFRAQGWEIVPDPNSPGNLAVHHRGDQDATATLESVIFENAVWRLWVMRTGRGTTFLEWNNSNLIQSTGSEFKAYQMELGFLEQGHHAMYRVEWPNSHVTAGQGDYPIPDNTWVLYEVIQQEDETEIRVNHTRIISYQDPYPLPAGNIGFEVFASDDPNFHIYIDNLSICRINEPSPIDDH